MYFTTKILFISILCLSINSCEPNKSPENYSEITVSDSGKKKGNTQFKLNEEPQLNISMSLNPKEYVSWLSNENTGNTLLKKKKINEFQYSCKYLPLDYMVANELMDKQIASSTQDSLELEYEGMEYFELKISVDNFNDEPAKYQTLNMEHYQTRIMYMSFGIQNDLKLQIGTDKIKCDLLHFERTYGVAPHAKFVMGFSKENIDIDELNNTGMTLIFNDDLFQKGYIKFFWSPNDLNSIPKMITA